MNRSAVPCPHCGGDIDPDASYCPHCGSSDSDGWRDEPEDWLDDDFDYDEFVEQNLSSSNRATQVSPLWRWTAAVLLTLILISFLASLLGGEPPVLDPPVLETR